jgi:hypothetical protein
MIRECKLLTVGPNWAVRLDTGVGVGKCPVGKLWIGGVRWRMRAIPVEDVAAGFLEHTGTAAAAARVVEGVAVQAVVVWSFRVCILSSRFAVRMDAGVCTSVLSSGCRVCKPWDAGQT